MPALTAASPSHVTSSSASISTSQHPSAPSSGPRSASASYSQSSMPSTPQDGLDIEPDEEWKENVKRSIQENLQTMLQEAKASLAKKIDENPQNKEALIDDHKNRTLPSIRRMAEETYQAELERERQERTWALRPPAAFVKQQQEIMDKIKSTNSTAAISVTSVLNNGTSTTTSASTSGQAHSRIDIPGNGFQSRPRGELRPSAVKPPIIFPVQEYPIPVLPPELEERRRASDAHNGAGTKNRDEFLSSVRRPPWVPADRDHRPSLPEGWTQPSFPVPFNESNELQRPPSSSASSIRSKPSLSEVRMGPNNASPTKSSNLDRARTVSERHLATSPPTGTSLHEIWKPSISPEEDAAASNNKRYSVGRRNSNASMRSIGSASSALRGSSETIPERVDSGQEDSESSSVDKKGKGKEKMYFSAAAAAAAAAASNVSRPASASPALNTAGPCPKPPLSEDRNPREREYSNTFGPYNTLQRSNKPSLTSLNGTDELERHSVPLSSASRNRNFDQEDRSDKRERLDMMNGGIATPGEFSESIYPRPYNDRPNLGRSMSYTRPPPSLRDEHDRRDEYYHRANVYASSPSVPVPVPGRSPNPNSAFPADRGEAGGPSSLTGSVVGSWRDWQPRNSPFPDQERDRDYDREKERDKYERPGWQGLMRSRPPDLYNGGYGTAAGTREKERCDGEFVEEFDEVSHFGTSIRRKTEADVKKLEDIKKREEETKRKEEGLAKREDDAKKREGDTKRREEEVIKKENKLLSREEFTKSKELELSELESQLNRQDKEIESRMTNVMRREAELTKREGGLKKREDLVREQAGSVKEQKEQFKKEQDEARKVREEAGEKELEVAKREEMVKKLEAGTNKLRAQVEERESAVEDREEELKRKEDVLKRREDDVKRKEDENKKKVLEAKKREADFARRGEDAAMKEKFLNEREDALKRREDGLGNKEKDIRRREDDLLISKEELEEQERDLEKRQEEVRRVEDDVNRTRKALEAREEDVRTKSNELQKRELDFLNKMKQRLDEEGTDKVEEKEREKQRKGDREQKEQDRRDWEQRLRGQREQVEMERLERERLERERLERERLEREEERGKREEREKLQERKEREERLRKQQEEERQHGLEDRERQREREEKARREWEGKQRREKELKEEKEKEVKEAKEREQRERDFRFKEEQERVRQQMEYQRSQRQREERKRQDSAGADSPWPGTPSSSPWSGVPPSGPWPSASSSSPGPGTTRAPPTRANSTTTTTTDSWGGSTNSSAWGASSGSSAWTSAKSTSASSTASNATPRAKPTSTPGPQRRPSMNSSAYPSTPMSDADRQRKMEEESQKMHEKFRLDQERIATERQAKLARGNLTKETMMQIYELHERYWAFLPNRDELHWDHFPWPMFALPKNPEEITGGAILAYLNPDCYDKDKQRSLKDRIKDQIKKWHPDRFETKLLPKVVENQKDIVKIGAGAVVRYLNDLLDKAPGLMNV